MEVRFKFHGVGYDDNYQVSVRIDNNQYMTFNSILDINLDIDTIHNFEAIFMNKIIKGSLYINSDYYEFNFTNPRMITFILKDYYYNLLISKGEIILE